MHIHITTFEKWLLRVGVTVLSFGLAASQMVWAKGDDVDALRKQLDGQQELILKQGELLRKQQRANELQLQQIQELKTRVDRLETESGRPLSAAPPPVSSDSSPATAANVSKDSDKIGVTTIEEVRDSVGDLNTAAVKKGDFPGSFKIPGPGTISLRIGGFIKTVAYYDTDAEAEGAVFLPAFLGVRRNDKSGNFSINASTSRLILDARSPVRNGNVRGYLEFDLNDNNDDSPDLNVRHAYGLWESPWGTLTAGQTWSTFMDLQTLPEGLTEPTLSGAIFQRQPLLRWTQPLDAHMKMHLAIEDPNSDDVFNDQGSFSHSNVPDVVLAGELTDPDVGHIRIGGLYRRVKVDTDDGGNSNSQANAWGVSTGLHLNTVGKDRVILSGSYGEGLGRYLLGIVPTAGGVVNPADGDLKLRKNYGGFVAYQRYWSGHFRSSFALGHARAKTFSGQPGSAFSNSTYGYGNLMWSVLPYLTFGIEYAYGRREDKDNSDKDNHRIMIGTQIF